jgi:hypothetical protein
MARLLDRPLRARWPEGGSTRTSPGEFLSPQELRAGVIWSSFRPQLHRAAETITELMSAQRSS